MLLLNNQASQNKPSLNIDSLDVVQVSNGDLGRVVHIFLGLGTVKHGLDKANLNCSAAIVDVDGLYLNMSVQTSAEKGRAIEIFTAVVPKPVTQTHSRQEFIRSLRSQ